MAAPAEPAPFGRGRVLQLVLGSLGLLVALTLVGSAAAATWALETHGDGSGYLTLDTHRFETSSYALQGQSLDVNTKSPIWALADHLGRVRITATSTRAAKPLFVGIARTEDADRYLAGVAHDEARELELDPVRVEYRRFGGGAPAAVPAARSFWRAHATGTGTQRIDWPIEKGRWTVVAMNGDGSRSVSLDAQLAARVSSAWWIVAGLFVLGGLSLLGGGALVYSGARTRSPVTKAERVSA
jgi:hypothetical protein